MIDPGSTSAEIGTPLKDSGEELIYHSNRLQSKGIQRATFDYYFRKLRGEILDAIHDGALSDEPKSAETCGRLCNECQSLFVYVHNKGVSPTNSAAEQALRKSVISENCASGQKRGPPVRIWQSSCRLQKPAVEWADARSTTSRMLSRLPSAPSLLPNSSRKTDHAVSGYSWWCAGQ